MNYLLKNGTNVIIRSPKIEDAAAMVNLITVADAETRFLSREPGEFCTPVEREREIIANVLGDKDAAWFVAEYDNEFVGQCSVGLVRKIERYRHRAEVAFVILEKYCGLGIGGKMMEECVKWCKANNVTQMELLVVKDNDRAIKMYRGFGFDIVGTVPNAMRYRDGSYTDEYMMVKYI